MKGIIRIGAKTSAGRVEVYGEKTLKDLERCDDF